MITSSKQNGLSQIWIVVIAVVVLIVFVLVSFVLGAMAGRTGLQKVGLAATDTPTATATSTSTRTPAFTATPIPTLTPSHTPMPTATPTETPDRAATRSVEMTGLSTAVAAALSQTPAALQPEAPTATLMPDIQATAVAQEDLLFDLVAAALTARPPSATLEAAAQPEPTDAAGTTPARATSLAHLVEAALTAQPTATSTPLPFSELHARSWGMTVPYPDGWSVFDFSDLSSAAFADDSAVDFVILGTGRGKATGLEDAAGLAIVRTMEVSNFDMASVQRELAENPSMGDLDLEVLEPRTIGGRSAEGAAFRIRAPDEIAVVRGDEFRGEFYLLESESDGSGYVLITGSTGPSWDEYRPVFRLILDGITWS